MKGSNGAAAKGDVAAWEGIWRVSDPRAAAAILRQARIRDDETACLAGLLRSTFPAAT